MSMMMMMLLTAVKPVSILFTLTLGAFPSIGGSRIFRGGATLGTRASEASEHLGGLGLRENEIARIWNDIEIT